MSVQGITSDLGDLKLKDGKSVKVKFGGAITPTPTLTRTIEGASSITIPIYDPDMKFLRDELLSAKFNVEVDGLHFRYVGASKSGKTLTLTFEDRDVAILRESVGPKRALRKSSLKSKKGLTRAEFIKILVEEGNPALDFFCPQLHTFQPIKTERQGKKASEDAKATRGKGIGDVKGLTVEGVKATPGQIEKANRGLNVAASLKAPRQVELALLVAMMDESHIGELTSNILEQESFTAPNTDHSNVEEAAHGFLTGYNAGEPGAIGVYRANPGMSPAEIATTVQRNRDGAAPYERFSREAVEWLEAYGGGEGEVGSTTVTEPYRFEVKKGETYWAAIQRLAKEVNWRAFIVAGRFFFIDEIELIRGMVRLAIDSDTNGVEDVDFDYHVNKKVTEVKVSALVSQWQPPPAAVFTLADYGPASIGTGEAPVKDKKAPHVSRAVKASTHEGRGRYLVASIESPLSGPSDARLGTITGKKPTRPLPEPAPETKTASSGSSTGSGSSTSAPPGAPAAIQRMIDEIDATDGTFVYKWAGGHQSVQALHERLKEYDCSGYVSHILWAGGELSSPEASTALESLGEAGKGQWITVYANAEHAFGEIKTADGWRGFQSGGQANSTGWCEESALDDRSRFTARHPAGL